MGLDPKRYSEDFIFALQVQLGEIFATFKITGSLLDKDLVKVLGTKTFAPQDLQYKNTARTGSHITAATLAFPYLLACIKVTPKAHASSSDDANEGFRDAMVLYGNYPKNLEFLMDLGKSSPKSGTTFNVTSADFPNIRSLGKSAGANCEFSQLGRGLLVEKGTKIRCTATRAAAVKLSHPPSNGTYPPGTWTGLNSPGKTKYITGTGGVNHPSTNEPSLILISSYNGNSKVTAGTNVTDPVSVNVKYDIQGLTADPTSEIVTINNEIVAITGGSQATRTTCNLYSSMKELVATGDKSGTSLPTATGYIFYGINLTSIAGLFKTSDMAMAIEILIVSDTKLTEFDAAVKKAADLAAGIGKLGSPIDLKSLLAVITIQDKKFMPPTATVNLKKFIIYTQNNTEASALFKDSRHATFKKALKAGAGADAQWYPQMIAAWNASQAA